MACMNMGDCILRLQGLRTLLREPVPCRAVSKMVSLIGHGDDIMTRCFALGFELNSQHFIS
jgi:hypothetical protein